jgi:DNA-binding transcriptional MerR regulator
MAEKTEDLNQDSEGSYRISELVAASGVSRDMIKYYLRAGLLPQAEKPRPNLSLYTGNHLALVGLVRRFQEETKLSLPEIAEVFSAAGHDANAIEIELLSARRRVSDDDNIIPIKVDHQSTSSLNFPKEFLQQLESAALLEDADQPGEREEQLAALLWAGHNAGVPLAFFESAREKLAELAELEVKTLIAIKRPGLSFSEMQEAVTDVDRLINRWMVAEKNRQIRNRFQRVLDNSERALSTLQDTIYRPSPLFRERHRIEDLLRGLAEAPYAGALPSRESHNLSFACILLGEYEQAIALAEAALSTTPGDAIAIALVTIAHGLQGKVDEAFEYGARLEHCADKHPAILQARMLALLSKAAKLRGVADTAELMKSAGEIFLEVPAEPSAGQPEAILLLARANVAFPDFANSRPLAIRALVALLEQLETSAIELSGFNVEGLRDSVQTVYRIYALYYLGVLYAMDGDHARAGKCFEQVIQLDPASNFGKSAYLRLGRNE